MTKRDKTLTKWKNNTPKEVRRDSVEAILDYYFKGQYRWEGTSHVVLQDDRLLKYENYKPYGEISIPCKNGKKFRGRYIKELIKVIEILDLWNKEG